MLRIIFNLLILLFIFILPVYISVTIIVIGILLWNNFAESIVYAFLIDILYSGGSIFSLHFAYFFTVFILTLYLVSFRFKQSVRLSS